MAVVISAQLPIFFKLGEGYCIYQLEIFNIKERIGNVHELCNKDSVIARAFRFFHVISAPVVRLRTAYRSHTCLNGFKFF